MSSEKCSELRELSCAVFLPALLHGLLIVSRGGGEEVSDLLFKLGERLSTLLRQGDGASYIVCIKGDTCSLKAGAQEGSQTLIAGGLDIMMVEPLALLVVELSTSLAALLDTEVADQLFHAHDFLVVITGIPAEECDEVHDSLGEVTALTVA